jgi:cytidylate kinase
MYRAATLSILQNNVSLSSEQKIISHINDITLEVIWEVFSQPEVKIDGINITSQLKNKVIEDNVSTISKIPKVRSFMVDYQRNHAKQSPIVMAGRDIGTRVLVESKVKFFLHAPPEIRASRRQKELKASGDMRSFEEVLQQTKKRDSLDQTGKRAILIEQAAPDAQVIRTENLSINELIKHCSKIYNELIEK